MGAWSKTILDEIQSMRKELFAISDRVSILEADSLAHSRRIAFYDGVQSERAATAKAVLDAAELRHATHDPTHVVIDKVNLDDLRETQ